MISSTVLKGHESYVYIKERQRVFYSEISVDFIVGSSETSPKLCPILPTVVLVFVYDLIVFQL